MHADVDSDAQANGAEGAPLIFRKACVDVDRECDPGSREEQFKRLPQLPVPSIAAASEQAKVRTTEHCKGDACVEREIAKMRRRRHVLPNAQGKRRRKERSD